MKRLVPVTAALLCTVFVFAQPTDAIQNWNTPPYWTPPQVVGGEAGLQKDGDSEVQAPASRPTERPDRFREREREPNEERPEERQRLFLRKRSPDGVSPLPMERYVKALAQMDLMPQYSTVAGRILPSRAEMAKTGMRKSLAALGTWSWLGPGNVGGRTRALLIHPTNPAIMYAAGVTGGIWKSTDAGASWAPLADLMANITICTLAMDPHDSNVIYAGTGEIFVGWRGAGVFKTTDGGTTWKQLPATNTSDFYYVNKIVVSPLASNRVYAGTSTGVWRSTNSGDTWTRVFATLSAWGGLTDLVIRSDQATDVILASDGGYLQSTIYRNLDAGGTGLWTAVLAEPNMTRTSLAIAPSSQGIMYALSATFEAGNYYDGLLAVFQSTDGGGTWTARVSNASPTGLNTCLLSGCDCNNRPSYSMGRYANVIAVDPLDPNRVWAGGIDIFRSDNGGATWGLAGAAIHVDNHAIIFHPQFNGTTNQQMYVGNDGGVWRTTNARGVTKTDMCGAWPSSTVAWANLNSGYGVTQFYYGLPYPDGATYFGGTQDNGTVRGTDSGGPNAWTGLYGGDGGYVAVDPGNTNILYAENLYGLSIRKSVDGGATWAAATAGIDPVGFSWIIPFVMDPSNALNLWTGGYKPWRTTNGATTWSQAGAAFSGGSWVTAIAVAPTDSNYILSGLNSGEVARSHTALTDDSSRVWAQVQPMKFPSYTSHVTFDPVNKDIAYATYSTFGVPHVWKSSDGGATFADIDGSGITGIPDIPVNSIVVDPANTSRLYIGTDLGVFTSIDGGANWAVENTGFANVITESLAITGSRLFAFTHGRGAYRVSLTSCAPWPTATVSGGGTICSGSSSALMLAALTGTGPWNVTWSDGVTQRGVAVSPATRSVSPSVTTTYTVTAVSNTKCSSDTSSGSALVTVNRAPAAPMITQTAGTKPSCAGASITLDAGAGYTSYAWSTGATTRTITVSPATSTSYSGTGTNTGCTSAAGSWTQAVNPVAASPVITAPASTVAGMAGVRASVVLHAGSSWSWTIQNGTITSGQGTSSISFAVGSAGQTTLTVVETNASRCVSALGNATVRVAMAPPANFYAMTPCRIVDTRNPTGPLGGPSIAAQRIRSFTVTGTCGLPQSASGVSMNVTVADATSTGNLTMYPGTGAAPGTSTLSFNVGRNRANNVILGLPGGVLSVQNRQSSGTVNLIIDINGYFQ